MYNKYESQNSLQSKDCHAIGLGRDRHLSAQGRGIGRVVEGIGVLAMVQAHCHCSLSLVFFGTLLKYWVKPAISSATSRRHLFMV